jgi:1-acyl-sn-glycerol-3-phosphate acyltransferase
MIKAQKQALPLWFFSTYFRIMQKFHFSSIEFKVLNSIPEGPVLLLQNHFSWWDGYWSYFIAEKILKRNFYVMMLEEQLKKRMFLTRTGTFSVNPTGNDMLASIRYAAGLLKNSENVVTIYPQGKIQSHYIDKLTFEKGAESLLRLAVLPVNVVFASAHINYGSLVRPRAQIFLKYTGNKKFTIKELETAYNDFFIETREQVINEKF